MVDISTMSQDRVALTLEIVICQQKESSEQLKKNIDALKQVELEYVKELRNLTLLFILTVIISGNLICK